MSRELTLLPSAGWREWRVWLMLTRGIYAKREQNPSLLRQSVHELFFTLLSGSLIANRWKSNYLLCSILIFHQIQRSFLAPYLKHWIWVPRTIQLGWLKSDACSLVTSQGGGWKVSSGLVLSDNDSLPSWVSETGRGSRFKVLTEFEYREPTFGWLKSDACLLVTSQGGGWKVSSRLALSDTQWNAKNAPLPSWLSETLGEGQTRHREEHLICKILIKGSRLKAPSWEN